MIKQGRLAYAALPHHINAGGLSPAHPTGKERQFLPASDKAAGVGNHGTGNKGAGAKGRNRHNLFYNVRNIKKLRK